MNHRPIPTATSKPSRRPTRTNKGGINDMLHLDHRFDDLVSAYNGPDVNGPMGVGTFNGARPGLPIGFTMRRDEDTKMRDRKLAKGVLGKVRHCQKNGSFN
ncbi:hypothetical protein HDV00_011491 [Rhizophlyctis rosea]|nr:hypothetical protein HDV00_011491 [Rhizophlyctis rosea]